MARLAWVAQLPQLQHVQHTSSAHLEQRTQQCELLLVHDDNVIRAVHSAFGPVHGLAVGKLHPALGIMMAVVVSAVRQSSIFCNRGSKGNIKTAHELGTCVCTACAQLEWA